MSSYRQTENKKELIAIAKNKEIIIKDDNNV